MSSEGARPAFDVLLVGAGGIGAPAALALVEARVGSVLVLDDDVVSTSNLHRQVLFSPPDVGRRKVEAFVEALGERASLRGLPLRVEALEERVTPKSALELVGLARVVVDATDNFATRFLLADACFLRGVPVVHAASIAWRATVLASAPSGRPCYRCLFEDLPEGEAPTCASAGVVGPVCGVAGHVAAERAKRILDGDASAHGTIFTFDGLTGKARDVAVRARRACPLCGERPAIEALDASRYEGARCG